MGAPRKCNCGKASCFTCHRRKIDEKYRQTAPPRSQKSKRTKPEISDAELDRRALILMGRTKDAK